MFYNRAKHYEILAQYHFGESVQGLPINIINMH